MKGRSLEEINKMFQDGVAVRDFGKYRCDVVDEVQPAKGHEGINNI